MYLDNILEILLMYLNFIKAYLVYWPLENIHKQYLLLLVNPFYSNKK